MSYKSIEQNTTYNNFLMNNFNLVLLMGLLVWSSFGQGFIGFGVVGPFTAPAFRCLSSGVHGSVQYAVIRAYQNSQSPAGIDPNAIQTIRNANAAGYFISLYVELCRGTNATSQINLVNS